MLDREFISAYTISMVHQTVYLSRATFSFNEEQLNKVLESARAYNPSKEITGILIYNSGYFLQLLEGPKPFVLELYSKISRDIRHNQITTLVQGDQAQRIYSDWSMAYANLDHYNDDIGNKVKSWFDQATGGGNTTSNIELLNLIRRFHGSLK